MPYTWSVLASFGSFVGRSRYMKLKSGDSVKTHRDRTAHLIRPRGRGRGAVTEQPYEVYDRNTFVANALTGYWGRRFRVHIPIM